MRCSAKSPDKKYRRQVDTVPPGVPTYLVKGAGVSGAGLAQAPFFSAIAACAAARRAIGTR